MISDDTMAAIVAADPDLTRREEDAIKRALDALDKAAFVVAPERTAVVLRDAGVVGTLPAPRLQLRWESEFLCHYELVLPLRELDIRRELGDRDEVGSRFLAVPLGCTRRGGSGNVPVLEDGRVDMPYRDGCHIKWDAAALNLPAFAIWQDLVTRIESQTPGAPS